ncbi:MAG: galactose mutarotase [Bacteroidales bacterium]|nr:galactose mutarotase [Bacteroidales bacterium]
MKKTLFVLMAATVMIAASCTGKKAADSLKVDPALFEAVIDGKDVHLYTAENANGMVVQFTNYGARVVSIIVPDKNGEPKDVIWGFDSIEGYLTGDAFSGPVVGRYGNRIAKGAFTLDGVTYQVDQNENGNHLHGGKKGIYAVVWDCKQYNNAQGEPVVEMTYNSPDGEMGYPGNMKITVVYTVKNDNSLAITHKATTDKACPVNLTFHPYINLHGTSEVSSNSHLLYIDADTFTATDRALIPTGEFTPVAGTAMDFNTPTEVGSRPDMSVEAINIANGGYDQNYVLNHPGDMSKPCATLYEPATGIFMEIFTDQPGLQFYSGPAMNGTDVGKRGDVHHRFSGIALETQKFPDAPNQPGFPNTILRPGEEYVHNAIYKFSTK